MLIVFDETVRRGLGALIRLAGIRPGAWITVSVLLMLAQTALSTIPVIAMVPLMQLFSSSGEVSSVVSAVAEMIGTAEPQILIPVFALCIGIVFLLCSAFSVLVTWWQAGRVSRLGAEANAALLSKYASESYESHRARANAEIIRNINVAPTVATALANVLTIYTSVLTLIGICWVLLAASPLVTILTIVLFGGLMTIAQRTLRRAQRRAGKEVAAANLLGWSYLLPLIDGFREVRLSGSTRRLLDGYRHNLLRTTHANRVVTTLSSVPAAVSQVAFALAVAGIAAILFSTGSAASAITILGLFAAAAMRALPTMNLLFATVGYVRSAERSLEIIADEAESLEHAPANVDAPKSDHEYRGDIVLEGVTFGYADADRPIVNDLNLTIREHQTTAIVGASGAGKSTVVDLILGLLTPAAGSIRCGGVAIADDHAGWYRGLGVVPQDVYLLNDTLEANVAFGEPVSRAEREAIIQALDFAQLLPLLESLPDGLDTVIGERGARLSGGQRQRLGLARAMYRRPRILVLDEATSALDNETEAEITSALKALHGQVTIVVVAHRLSTVRDADKLVFLGAGRVEAEGTFEDVRGLSPSFARLVELGELS